MVDCSPVSVAAAFWMSRNAFGGACDNQNTVARETNCSQMFYEKWFAFFFLQLTLDTFLITPDICTLNLLNITR